MAEHPTQPTQPTPPMPSPAPSPDAHTDQAPASQPDWFNLVMRLIERVVALETWRSEVVIRLDKFDSRFSQLDRHMVEQDKVLSGQNSKLDTIEQILHTLHSGGVLAVKLLWGAFTLVAGAAIYFIVQAMSWGQQVAIVLAFLAAS